MPPPPAVPSAHPSTPLAARRPARSPTRCPARRPTRRPARTPARSTDGTSGLGPLHSHVMLLRRWGTVETRKKKEAFFRAPRDSQRSSLQETDHKVAGKHACRRHATEQNGSRRVTKKLFSNPPGPPKSMLTGRSAVTEKSECQMKSGNFSFKPIYLRPVSAK